MGHDGILFCNLDIMIYNINITRNGIVNCNFTDVLQMLTVVEVLMLELDGILKSVFRAWCLCANVLRATEV